MELQIREYEDWVAEDEAAAAAESKAAEEEELREEQALEAIVQEKVMI